jgi:YidC/Oxa1 family membrane protein insertase
MGQSQKDMMYIMPFFALSGLYWPFGLVLYWVTTNVWTLGQQWVLFRRYPQPVTAGAAAGTAAPSPVIAPSATGRSTTKPPKRVTSGPAGSGSAAGQADQGGSNGSAPRNANGAQPKNAGRKAAGAQPSGSSAAAQPSANGGGMLRRLGKRAEPEPPPPEPEVKLVRQQKQRQSRSKRSGKR